jgi:hypothetical protein
MPMDSILAGSQAARDLRLDGGDLDPTFTPRRINPVDKLIDELTAKVGLDRATAEKVVQFLKDNAHRLPELLQSDAARGVMDKLPGGLGGMLGGKG